MNTFPPEIIGRYKLLEQLGSGGMGVVYKAQDLKLKREVALKIMHPSLAHNQDFRDRFLQEAQSGARLKHPGIVQVHDVCEEGDYLFIVEDFIYGENLATRIKLLRAENRLMPVEEAVDLVRQVSLALGYAHEHGVLHRDIKPANIILEPVEGEKIPYRPVLTDLGLAKLLIGGLETQTGISMGTPAYMAPEQALGQTADARSDVYALGVLLYELITGRLPFNLKNISDAIRCHMHEPPPVPPPLQAGIPVELSSLLMQTLQRNRENRPTSAFDFATRLGLIFAPPKESPLPSGFVQEEDGSISKLAVGKVDGPTNVAGGESRGPSLWEKIRVYQDEQNFDRIEVFLPGGEIQVHPVERGPLIIGRDDSSDIVLDDLKASRKHARLEFDGQNYLLTDLNSTNGSFLGKTRLLAGVSEIWNPENPLRIGDHYLRLVRAKEGSESRRLKGEGTLVDLKMASASAGGGKIGLAVPQTNFSVEAGNTVVLLFSLINQGSLEDVFIISIEDLPGEWIQEPLDSLQLMPGEAKKISVSIHPPRQPQSRATRYPFILRVRSKIYPAEVVESRCALTILPYTQYTSQVVPQRLSSGEEGRINLENQGNVVETFHISFSDPENELVFSPSETQITVLEGKSKTVAFSARPKKNRWWGSQVFHPYSVSVSVERKPGSGDMKPAETNVMHGEVISRAKIVNWVVVLLILGFLVLMSGTFVSFLLLRDQDRDGLTTLEEIQQGTNPEGLDSDGDTIPDGTEVQNLGTNPLQRDSDGDRLDDYQEVSGCTNPVLKDSDKDGIEDGFDTEPCIAQSPLP